MNNEEVLNLKAHVIQIASTLINEISSDDTILSLNEDGSVSPDAVSNHHLIELLGNIDTEIFYHFCQTLFKWLDDPSNGYNNHPFTLDSYASLCDRNENNDAIFQKVADKQLGDGSYSIYTALVQGGDFFSTLWASKILLKYNHELFKETINNAIDFLLLKKDVTARTISQKGFLLYILLDDYNKYEKQINLLSRELFEFIKLKSFNDNIIETINEIYILEDLQKYYQITNNQEYGSLIDFKLIQFLELNVEFKFPKSFSRFSEVKPETLFYQLLLKTALLAYKHLTFIGEEKIALELNTILLKGYRKNRYIGILLSKKLKEYKQQYGNIESEFRHYDNALKQMWEKSNSDYEHSIFLMMPFKTDYNHRGLTKQIRNTCEKYGYKVFRVDDKHRKPFDTLWENIVLNMLGCKYGVSVYLSEKSRDRLTDELKFFENPNVALEFGFMKSRGKKILILKDKSSKTPSDLQGFLVKLFDIKNPDNTVPEPVELWIKEYLKKESKD